MPIALVWFRSDLRLADNPALHAALEAGFDPVPVYIHAPHEEGCWAPGAASNAWRHRSLKALDLALRQRGSRLLVRRGDSAMVLQQLIEQSRAQALFWNRKYEPATQPRDAAIKQALKQRHVQVRSCNAALLAEPWDVQTRTGEPYKVFTAFYRNVMAGLAQRALQDAPEALPAVPSALKGEGIDALGLAPALNWDAGFWEIWQAGEAGAHQALEVFVEGALRGYLDQRDLPDRIGTSRLSPHLHFGEIAPWRVIARLQAQRGVSLDRDIDGFIRQLVWREFAHHLLHHFPHTAQQNLNPRFDRFDWASTAPGPLQAWQHGRTGVPIVDAGMRELWQTGMMHNRVRMIVASYLTKHLRVHWLEGARWFWQTLVDADLANNTLGWQWVAGTGADAAPYFRVFNPVTQARKFDPQARYITRWVPELEALPVNARFAPWEFPQLRKGRACDYPHQPIVDLAKGRQAALAAYARTR
ncbi:cryptochrome/photolyase family protein [Pseudoxanthomonas spadix]|uniref:cryptochrome/photolyase family protein n=1 Tax=Pseudoxanthomonas spadix TaxID=415229 RepID=UPI000EFE9208|nr:deoxyribodipyrimidine photo-lyase [Pseudoxanthomonas spadix]MBP3975610.1 deoxyribodipyrimidine photo-lyase [Pseudoxanthomonas spadix]RMW92679.1 deoxyribodipyrimidine photo-lyase [Pseudoxanthomonas spadix]